MSALRGGRRACRLLRQLDGVRFGNAGDAATSGTSGATSASSTCQAPGFTPMCLQSTRWSGSLPSDLERAANNARFPTSSRTQEQSSSPSTSAKDDIVDDETARMHKEQQDVVSNFMFPWERRQMQGGALSTWEQWYWGVFVLAIAVFLFNRAGSWTNSEEDIEKATAEKRRQEEMERLKVARARLIMTGGSVLVGDDEDDPFENMTPQEVESFVQSHTGGSTQDPFAGMTPEEIDAYVKEHNL